MPNPSPSYTPGASVAASAIAPGDMIYARISRFTKAPATPVEVLRASRYPSAPNLVRLVVQSPYQRQSPWQIGPLQPTSTFTRAVLVP